MDFELNTWLGPDDRVCGWEDPKVQVAAAWKRDEAKFPRLSLLARRFLCILPTSAASERVRSGFGHVLTAESSKMDSDLAVKTMYLRSNTAILAQLPAFS